MRYFDRLLYLTSSVTAVATVAGIAFVNPYLFKLSTWGSFLKKIPVIWDTTVWSESLEAAESALPSDEGMYRGNAERQARYRVRSLAFDLKSAWITEPINVGVHSASKASVVIDDERLYVGGDTAWFHCFDLKGKLLWKTYLADSERGIHSTGVVDHDSVFVGSYRGTFYRLDKKTGHMIWSRTIGEAIGASPLPLGDSLIVNVEIMPRNGYLIRLRRKDGALMWRSDLMGEQSHSSPAFDSTSQSVVVGVNDASIQSFDVETGRRRWRKPIGGPSKSTPWLEAGVGYTTSWGEEIVAFSVSDGSVRWRAALGARSMSSPVVLGGKAVVTLDQSGKLSSFDITTGEPLWSVLAQDGNLDVQPNSRVQSSPIVVTDGRSEQILAVCGSRRLCLITSDGRIRKTWPIPGYFTGSPVVSGSALFMSFNEGGVQRFDFVYL